MRKMSIGENYVGKIAPVPSDISRFPGGTDCAVCGKQQKKGSRNGSLPWSSGGSPLETGRSAERENQKPSRSSRPFVHRFVWGGL